MKPANHLILSNSQQDLIREFLSKAGSEYVDELFALTRRGNKRRYFSCGSIEIATSLSDEDLFDLAQQGLIEIRADPLSIKFLGKVQEQTIENTPVMSKKGPNNEPNHRVVQMDIIQVYAWLGVSIIAALFSLVLFGTAVQQVVNQNLPAGLLAGISTPFAGFLTVVFFRNYDKANERLRSLRSEPTSTQEQDERS
jgi:hypothetical protein